MKKLQTIQCRARIVNPVMDTNIKNLVNVFIDRVLEEYRLGLLKRLNK